MQTKHCGRCKIDKKFEEFNKSKTGTFGLYGHCKECAKDCYSKYKKSDKGKESNARYYNKNKERILKNVSKHRKTPHARKLAKIARNKLYKSNISFRISVNVRNRTRQALKQMHKSESILKLLGCSIEKLKLHLESQFQLGMTWDNYGYRGWHIDHKIPCSAFNLTIVEEQAKCFHYTNLQPLWMKDNISKGGRK